MLKEKFIKKYSPLYTKYNVFDVKFNPKLKKNQSRYQIFTESVFSVTLSTPPNLKLYINFNDAGIDDSTIYDEFLKIVSTISEIEVDIADREGNIIEKRIYPGKFIEVIHTELSYVGDLKFLGIFEIDIKKLLNK